MLGSRLGNIFSFGMDALMRVEDPDKTTVFAIHDTVLASVNASLQI